MCWAPTWAAATTRATRIRPPDNTQPEVTRMTRKLQVDAQPFAFDCEVERTALVIIDMQRDFIEPGGFGESLGNDVALLAAIVPACKAVLSAWREAGGLVVHTREAHRPDLADCPPAKRNRGNPRLRI